MIILINCIIIGLFGFGLFSKNILKDDQLWIGSICEGISFIYTVAVSVINWWDNSQDSLIPTTYFVDRQSTIEELVKRLYSIIIEKDKEKVISIICDSTPGIGKSEILLKFRQILQNKRTAKDYIVDKSIYKKYRLIKRKIGKVYLTDYLGDRTIDYINNLPYIINAYNIVLVDNLPQIQHNKFDKHFIIVYCKTLSVIEEYDHNNILLPHLSTPDIALLYKKKFGIPIQNKLLKKVTEYANGDLSKINAIFSSKEALNDFEQNSDFIFELKMHMQTGNYPMARRIINGMTSSQKSMLEKREDDYYSFSFICADLLHLENKYYQALNAFDQLRITYLSVATRQIQIIEKISHIKKHLGDFSGAINELKRLPRELRISKSVSLLLLSYSQYHNIQDLMSAKECLNIMESEKEKYITKAKDSFHTYQAVVFIYEYKYNLAHNTINIAINLYEKNDSRFLNNCYYIKAEIYRHEGKFVKACEYYQKCLDSYRFNGDFDVYSLAYIMIVYLNKVYNAKHKFYENISLELVKQRCVELGMNYNKTLSMWVSEILLCLDHNKIQETEAIQQALDFGVFFIP